MDEQRSEQAVGLRQLWEIVRRLEKAAVEDRKELRQLGRDVRAGFAHVQERLEGDVAAEKARLTEAQNLRTVAVKFIHQVIADIHNERPVTQERRAEAMRSLQHVIGVIPPNATEQQVRKATDEAAWLHSELGDALLVLKERERAERAAQNRHSAEAKA